MYANLKTGQRVGLILDFETRSPVDLSVHGASVYARDPRTEIMCAVAADVIWNGTRFETDTRNARTWRMGEPVTAGFWPKEGETLFAFNALFEVLIGTHVWKKTINPDRVYCIQCHALYNGLPASLDEVSAAVPLGTKKDSAGSRLMKQMCNPKDNGEYLFDSDKFQSLINYCYVDILAEAELLRHPRTRILSEHELRCYQETLAINLDGISVDLELASKAQKLVDKTVADIKKKIPGVNLRSHTQIKEIANQAGYVMGSTDKEHITKYLKDPKLPAALRVILEAKDLGVGSSSVGKFESLMDYTDQDGKLRGSYRHHGAIRTGRWTSQGVQIQNLPRGEKYIITSDKDTKRCLLPEVREMIRIGDYDGIYIITNGRPMDALRSAIRSTFAPPKDYIFVQRDLSAIEARGVLWVAKAKNLKIFNEFDAGVGEEPYVIFAKRLNTDRFMGKQGILSTGYGVGAKRFAQMCETYGRKITEEFAQSCLDLYKQMFPEVPKFWEKVGEAAIQAVDKPGTLFSVETPTNAIKFLHEKGNLLLKLPSGRVLTYWDAKLSPGKYGPELGYMSLGAEDGKQVGWHRTRTWGGALTGHIVQGFSACIMREILLNLRTEGLPSCMVTHDEAVLMVKESDADACYSRMGDIIKRPPAWATGLPIQSKGWINAFFIKD